MAAERIEEPTEEDRGGSGVTDVTTRGRRGEAAVRRRRAAAGRHAAGATVAHATVVMDRREPVFDHATSHVLVADRTSGRPIGGPTPAELSVPSRVRLRLARVGPWSACKLALLFGTLIMAAVVAGLIVLYGLLNTAGVLQGVQKLVNSSGVGHHFRFDGGWLLARVLWVAAGMVIAGAIIAVCMTVLYNSLADLTGGLDMTLVERPEPVVQTPEGPTWTSRFGGTRVWQQDPAGEADPDLGFPEASGL